MSSSALPQPPPHANTSRPSSLSPLPQHGPTPPAPPPEAEAEPHRPPFSPFFTLVEDAPTPSHHHPTVHYIFSDDDADVITEAALRALSRRPTPAPKQPVSSTSSLRQDSSSGSIRSMKQSPPQPKERYIVLDVGPSGDTVMAAHSLTSDWQVLGVEVTNAPTWVAEDENPAGGGGSSNVGLMLRIEGTDSNLGAVDVVGGKKAADGPTTDVDMHELTALFDRRMAMLRKVLEAAGERGEGAA